MCKRKTVVIIVCWTYLLDHRESILQLDVQNSLLLQIPDQYTTIPS